MDFLLSVWNWVVGQFADEVPDCVSLCEFDCRKPQCTEVEWQVCERRSQRAAGELMPATKPASDGIVA